MITMNRVSVDPCSAARDAREIPALVRQLDDLAKEPLPTFPATLTPIPRVLDWNDAPCPECGAPMCDNGLLIWCDQGHTFAFSNENRGNLMSGGAQ